MYFLYRAARQGVFGKCEQFSRSSITDALFIYLDGEPEPESIDRVDLYFRNRPLVCLTEGWEEQIKTQYPDAAIYRRTMMKPACRFIIPKKLELPESYRLAGMDETAFERHPFFSWEELFRLGRFSGGGLRRCSISWSGDCGSCLFLSEREQ